MQKFGATIFQFTSPQRGWRITRASGGNVRNFNSHPHKGDDTVCLLASHKTYLFQFTSPQRGWLSNLDTLFLQYLISIHIPTKGMTPYPQTIRQWFSISIHIPTKGMTSMSSSDALSRALFQFTSPQRGWQGVRYALVLAMIISIHIPTKGMTTSRTKLTGRQSDFNSHPHKGDDACSTGNRPLRCNFNSHPHKGDDGKKGAGMKRGDYFNSHPHKGDDRSGQPVWRSLQKFQFTSPQRGWRAKRPN